MNVFFRQDVLPEKKNCQFCRKCTTEKAFLQIQASLSNIVFYSNSKLVKQIIRHEFLSQTPRLCNLSHPRGWPRSVLLLCGWVLYGVPSTLALKHLETFESFQSRVRLCVRAPCIAYHVQLMVAVLEVLSLSVKIFSLNWRESLV